MFPRRSCRSALILAAVVMLGGCGLAATGRSRAKAPATPSAAPAVSVPYSARHQATIAVENGDGMAAVAGALWVKTDDGRVVRIDPKTNRVTREITVDTTSDPSQYCQGIGTDGTSVWACATADDGVGLVQIDPDTNGIVRRVPVGKVFDQLSLPATARGIWVLTGDATKASVVEPTTGRVTVYPLGMACQQLAARANRAVATCRTANTTIVLDAVSGAVAGRVSLPTPGVAALSGADVWVDTAAGLTRLTHDLAIGTVIKGITAGLDGDLIAAADSVWLRAADGTITRIDPVSGRIIEQITPDRPLTGGSLLIAFGSIWTTSSDEGTLIRLRLNG